MTACGTRGYQKVAEPFFILLLFTLFSCVKKIGESCGYVGLLSLTFQRNSSNCLALVPHRQLQSVGHIGLISLKSIPAKHLKNSRNVLERSGNLI